MKQPFVPPVLPQNEDKPSHLALYVGEKLVGFNKRQRILAEKRINDVLYEIESEGISNTMDYSSISSGVNSGTYMALLNDNELETLIGQGDGGYRDLFRRAK